MIRGLRESFLPFFLGSFSLLPSFLCRILSGCHRSPSLGKFLRFIVILVSLLFACWRFAPRGGFKADDVEARCDLSLIFFEHFWNGANIFTPPPDSSFIFCRDGFTNPFLFTSLLAHESLKPSLACTHRLHVDISFLRGYPTPPVPTLCRSRLSNGLCSLSWTIPNVGVT